MAVAKKCPFLGVPIINEDDSILGSFLGLPIYGNRHVIREES